MKRSAPATERNRDPILAVLQRFLPTEGTLLEIACGTGEHAAYFAPRFPGLTWQPTDQDMAALESTTHWVADAELANLKPPLRLDVRETPWPVERADVIYCANMIHISPWASGQALIEGAGRILPASGLLILYGPFMVGGKHTAPSNEQFDGWLKAQSPSWGVRDLDVVKAEAAKAGLEHVETVQMPANNLTVVWRKL
jgi:SAM-dependent methyltransferase